MLVIIDAVKSSTFQTHYKLVGAVHGSSINSADCVKQERELKLQRSAQKTGTEFRVIARVLNIV